MTIADTGFFSRWARLAWGAYAWLVFAAIVTGALLGVLLLPGLDRRRRWARACARSFFVGTRIPVTETGFEKIPDGHCIVVANHASYLDGVIMQAYLPARFSFVIKSEVQRVPVMHFLLRRVGSRFVERFTAAASARDARSLLKAASAGESLAVFPEGTFIATPGLGRFRPGAFASAIKGAIPLVPVAINGSRAILPPTTLWPQRKPLCITVLDPVDPGDHAYSSSAALAAVARERILEVLDEPDLLAAPAR
ncbi:MAG: 1-acyl-sn-glycerol-3-phosphate acyltransferase [Gammaproteobacteria bacterium]|nr:1-acyl-sn-glycerol-3-phosphate acyltransferase [Gammaproteobacteria bacterium]MDH4253000.1 1-acyl-sn-glycerol-3-phosphate acyltransferase [Gammaproteobacteria bacterium]MDH5308578.1 1-acyl-sn-glycerol-3-phosphate acyltransferase [Gammaproteobacteria bacterium]